MNEKNLDSVRNNANGNESKIPVVSICVIGVFLLAPVGLDYFNILEKFGIETSNWITYLSSLISTTGAVVGTYIYTKKSNDDAIKTQEHLNEVKITSDKKNYENLLEAQRKNHLEKMNLDREIAYRSINKQNSEVILSEIRKFYANACYFSALNQIANTLGILDLFDYELEKIKENNIIFLRHLKEDFSYDHQIVDKINLIDVNLDNIEYFTSCKELFALFYGFSDSTNKKLNIQHAEEKAKKKLYEILYRPVRHKHLKERVILWINNEGKYLELKEKDEVDQIQILESISKLKIIFNDPNLTCDEFKEIIEYPKYKIIINSLKEIYSDVHEDSVIEYLYILCRDCYKLVNGQRLYDNLGTNSDEFEKLFIEKFKADYFENIPQNNRIYQNVEKYHYL